MATAESARPRRAAAPCPRRTFERAALATLGLLWLVVVTGGLVRLTASGLGCPHWPTCEANSLVAADQLPLRDRVLEPRDLGHRDARGGGHRLAGVPHRGAAAGGARGRRWRRPPGTVAQVPLGAVTVAFDLNPLLVMSHFLLAMAVLASATWVDLPRRRPGPRGGAGKADGRRQALLAWLAVAACLVLVTTGAVRDGGRPARRRHRPADRAAGQLLRRRLGARAGRGHVHGRVPGGRGAAVAA